MLKHLDIFSGIGGFALGLERTGGFETIAFCEIEQFPRQVLKKHWPKAKQYEDVKKLSKIIIQRDGIAVDIITGGFPCQDISVAGKQAGISKHTRSGLWSELVRLIGELRPKYAIVENVPDLLTGPKNKRGGWFSRILGDLAEVGYDAEWQVISAKDVGAPHKRERVWIIAYPSCGRCKHGSDNRQRRPILSNKNWHAAKNQQKRNRRFGGANTACTDNVTHANRERCRGGGIHKNSNLRAGEVCKNERKNRHEIRSKTINRDELHSNVAHNGRKRIQGSDQKPIQRKPTFSWCEDVRRVEDYFNRPNIPTPLFRGGRDGLPNWMDRIKGLGNAIVPDIAELLGYCILEDAKGANNGS